MKRMVMIVMCMMVLGLAGCTLFNNPPPAKIGVELVPLPMKTTIDGKVVEQVGYMPQITISQPKDTTIEGANLTWNVNGTGNLIIGKYSSGYGEGYVGAIKANADAGAAIAGAVVSAALETTKTMAPIPVK